MKYWSCWLGIITRLLIYDRRVVDDTGCKYFPLSGPGLWVLSIFINRTIRHPGCSAAAPMFWQLGQGPSTLITLWSGDNSYLNYLISFPGSNIDITTGEDGLLLGWILQSSIFDIDVCTAQPIGVKAQSLRELRIIFNQYRRMPSNLRPVSN